MPGIITLPLTIGLLVCLVFSLTFLCRVLGAIFSPQARRALLKKPFTHFLMFFAIPISIGFVFLINPLPLKIYELRKLARERIGEAGGLDVIKRGCVIVANESSNREEFIWMSDKTNSFQLPPAISALKPFMVLADAPEISGNFIPTVRIHILGHHSTDNSWPEYWLWYVGSDISTDSLKQIGQHSRNEEIRVLTNSVYELIQ